MLNYWIFYFLKKISKVFIEKFERYNNVDF